MENEKKEQEKPQEQQASQAEQPAEQKPDIYEQMKTLSEEEKKLCPNKISEYIQALYTRGLIEKMKDIGVKHVPISLTPSPIPKNLFEKIFFYQIAFNKIYNKLSNDQAFIEKTLEPISSNTQETNDIDTTYIDEVSNSIEIKPSSSDITSILYFSKYLNRSLSVTIVVYVAFFNVS